ncbi:MAG TPA: hypothetical protein VE959_03875 [Bryobacteraceae bacterium]|nr:hypothetical protein [Bryobacteraceae bacterium]
MVVFDLETHSVFWAPSPRNPMPMSLKPDIDPKNGKIDAPIELGGAPEFLASGGAGKVYINPMDKNEVAVVDIQARKVVARWPVAPGGAPVGMSIDSKQHRLSIGCRGVWGAATRIERRSAGEARHLHDRRGGASRVRIAVTLIHAALAGFIGDRFGLRYLSARMRGCAPANAASPLRAPRLRCGRALPGLSPETPSTPRRSGLLSAS